MNVYEARSEQITSGVDLPLALADGRIARTGNGGYQTIVDGHIAAEPVLPGTIDDQSIANHQVMHGCQPPPQESPHSITV
jgi:hypothetical protein